MGTASASEEEDLGGLKGKPPMTKKAHATEQRAPPTALAAHPPPKSLHAAKDWVVCRVFKKATPARHGTAGRRRGDADADMTPASPSPASSCVTESRSGMEEDEDETASNSPRRED
uniref:NAC domain-containing protein n=1 Tax=Aegilops tauschii TaxID=37682 RepID=R7VZL4_AEGTA